MSNDYAQDVTRFLVCSILAIIFVWAPLFLAYLKGILVGHREAAEASIAKNTPTWWRNARIMAQAKKEVENYDGEGTK